MQHPDGSIQWITKQIVGIGEDFSNQVGDGKVKSTLYDIRTRPIWIINISKVELIKLGTIPLQIILKSTINTNFRLVMTKESSPMMMTHTGNTSNLR